LACPYSCVQRWSETAASRAEDLPIAHAFDLSGGEVSLPWPTAFYLKNQRPAQKGAYQNQAGQETKARKGQLDGDRFDDIGRDQYFQAK
jgi:hypothetical protein